MNEKHIAQLEARLEQFVEGAFTNLFGKQISLHDVAVKLARSMESSLRDGRDGDARPVAPDRFMIHVHTQTFDRFQQVWASLSDTLSQQMVELATQSGYRLLNTPVIKLIADNHIPPSDVAIRATHAQPVDQSTQAMQPTNLKAGDKAPNNPHLIINGKRTVPLTGRLINIGRSDENHIMIEDAFVSRHHLQIRLRFGAYTLFDVNSRGGTLVNNVRVTEHRLQPGDVIRIGNTKLTYVTDDDKNDTSARTTQSIPPVDDGG